MGGVVSDIGELGQGVISGVDEGLTQLDDAIPQEAKIAAAIYLASQGLPVEGAALSGANAAVAADNAYLASQAAGAGAIATPVTTGSVLATELPAFGATNAGFTLPAIPPEVSAVSNANSAVNAVSGGTSAVPAAVTPSAVTTTGGTLSSAIPSAVTTAGEMTAQQTAEMIAKEQAGSTGLLGGALNWATASPQNALTAASLGLTAAKALGGGTTSTSSSSVDPDVKGTHGIGAVQGWRHRSGQCRHHDGRLSQLQHEFPDGWQPQHHRGVFGRCQQWRQHVGRRHPERDAACWNRCWRRR